MKRFFACLYPVSKRTRGSHFALGVQEQPGKSKVQHVDAVLGGQGTTDRKIGGFDISCGVRYFGKWYGKITVQESDGVDVPDGLQELVGNPKGGGGGEALAW